MLQPDFRWLWINFFKTEYNYNMPFWEWSEFYQIQGHPSQKFKKKEDHKWRTCHEKGQQCQLFMPRTRRRASISAAKKHDRGLLWKWQILILMAETWCVENRGCWFLKIRFFSRGFHPNIWDGNAKNAIRAKPWQRRTAYVEPPSAAPGRRRVKGKTNDHMTWLLMNIGRCLYAESLLNVASEKKFQALIVHRQTSNRVACSRNLHATKWCSRERSSLENGVLAKHKIQHIPKKKVQGAPLN